MTPAEIRAARRALDLSQSQLAARLGVHQKSVSKWERGEHPVPLHVALAVAHLSCPRGDAAAPAS